ncbi:MAG: hypothetical protein OES46_01270 [Gammaproteobacteria bacterium]|nr:hypothetical protein [Gammaproteobacteria bacterium]
MILATGFLLLGIGGILTGIRLSKRSERMFKTELRHTDDELHADKAEYPHDTEAQATKTLSRKH